MKDTAHRQVRVRASLVAPLLQQCLGGQEVQADQLTRSWAQDPDVGLEFVPVNPALPAVLRWLNRVPYLRTGVRLPVRLATLLPAIHKAHVVHIFTGAHSSFVVGALPAWLLAKLFRKQVLIHYHSPRGLHHLRSSRLARCVLRRSDAVVVPSRYLADIFATHAISAEIIPNVADVEHFRYLVRDPAPPVLLCTRNFDHYCGVDLVLRAFARVKAELPSARLLLVGRGPQEPALRELVNALGVTGVEFCGAVPRDRIAGYFQQAGVFVNGSRLDNMPVSILEAFASGLPVATSAAGGIPWMVEHGRTGLLSEPGDFHSLGQNIARLVTRPKLAAQIAAAAHQEIVAFDWNAVRPRWLAIYRALSVTPGREPSRALARSAHEITIPR